MSSIQSVFENGDLFMHIMSFNLEDAMKKYIQKIYPKWNKDDDGVMYMHTRRGRSWSIVHRGNIDTSPLVITVIDENGISDSVVNDSNIQLKNTSWYVPPSELKLYDPFDRYDYDLKVLDFKRSLQRKRADMLFTEFSLRIN